MKVISYSQMIQEYNSDELDSDDMIKRKSFLDSSYYSVIFEGGFLEFDSLNEWIRLNWERESPDWIFYGKTGYDYGCFEYFTLKEKRFKTLQDVIPNIYTVFPLSYPPNKVSKSISYDDWIEYSPKDKDDVIVRIEKEESK